MLKKHNQLFLTIMLVVDIGAVIFSWVFSYHFRFDFGLFSVPKGVPPLSQYLYFTPAVVIIWAVSMRLGGLYVPMRSDSRFNEYFRIFRTSTIAAVITMAAAFSFRGYSYSRLAMALFWIFSNISLVVSHAVTRAILREMRRRGRNLRYILIVGAGDLGQALAETFSRHPESGMIVKGILSDDPNDVGRKYHGYEVIGMTDNIKRLIHEHKVDQIFIALPHSAYDRLENTLNLLGEETVDIKLAPDILQFIQLNTSVEDFDGFPIISLSQSPMYGWNVVLKRAFDIILSLCFIIIWSPVMLIISALVKLGTKGPLFYKQERMSLGGEPFTIYKFRSMKMDAEKKTGAVWASSKDDRRTRVGQFLRKTSLDELPQLFNVLKGNMSLVGPRPERPVFVENFKKSVPMYMLRHKMKAGITGWAQVNGWRGDTSLDKRIEYDLYYIENWSMSFDIKILWLTVWKGFINKHAY